ncbi:cyanoexosortase B system-associated protein [Geitlerinema sp. PCC 9228]|jgi:cyanoexosortase B-associated protein|uniref:cyanoexosortase B system-associated protein n=1 Tax=Geitlerinema sp. PCC 9228 TaxID=111611 RepID=UPI0008F9DA8B|nr:cyanoexosortase B system-associated protein [Geitlerinema sp. PCC 9228]
MSSFLKFFQRLRKYKSTQLGLFVFLIAIAAIGVVPTYLRGRWLWSDDPIPVDNIDRLRQLRETGIDLPGWETVDANPVQMGGRKWIFQQMQANDRDQTAYLLLRPQVDAKDQPQVEWTDVDGWQQWKTDSRQSLQFDVSAPTVHARYYRAWQPAETFAIAQWYAFANGGGHASPSQWFWRDRQAQLQGDRVGWVAVSLMVPIEPLDDLENYTTEVKELAQTVQTALQEQVFAGKP